MPGRGGIEPSRKATGVDIAVRGIAKRFTGHAALHEVDLTIGSGELVALLGPSGSGKTTLLRILAGLEMPDAGTVHFDGVDATGIRVQDRGVGFVFQHYALFRHLTVADNIAYGLHVRPRAKRPPEQAIRRRVSDLLDLVQLSGLEGRYPAQLSGGQRQRVALARALAIEPRVLLLDEPFGALDAKVRKDLRRWLRGIHERTGQTTVFVTHDQDEALELADRVAILNQGRIEQVGDAEAIYDHPASAFVVSFVGEVAELAVSIRGGRVVFAGRELPVAAQGLPDGAGRLFLRPAETRLRPHAEAGLPARLVGVRRTSNGHRAEVEVEGHPGIIEVESDLLAGTIGGTVTLALDRARLFPA